jgi:hypothetical protein
MLEECGILDFPVLAGLAKLFSGLSGGLDGDSLGKLGKGDMGREVLKYIKMLYKLHIIGIVLSYLTQAASLSPFSINPGCRDKIDKIVAHSC